MMSSGAEVGRARRGFCWSIACGSGPLLVDTKRSEGVVWTLSIGWSR